MERETGAFSLRVGLVLSAALLPFGCHPVRPARPVANVSGAPCGEALTLALAIKRYAEANGQLPESREALRDFCRKESLPCANLDWTRVSWQRVEKDSLTVCYKASQGITIPISVATHPGSLCVGDQNLTEELEKKLHESKEE